MSLGAPHLHLRETTSTNDRARELALAGAPHGTTVTAGVQSAGRGRQGRVWTAPPDRALLLSVVLRDPPALLTLRAAVAVAVATGVVEAQIKWPNDVLVAGRKVAGILAEGRPQEGWAVLGIGLNVAVRPSEFPEELAERAGTLGRPLRDVPELRRLLLIALEGLLAEPAHVVLERWRDRDALLGREVRWGAGRGTAAGVDGEGRLRVEGDGGEVVLLDAGEVHLA